MALSLFSVAASVWLRPSGAPAPLRFVRDSRPLRLVGRRGAPVASHFPPGPTLQSPRPCLSPAGAARAWTVIATSSPPPARSPTRPALSPEAPRRPSRRRPLRAGAPPLRDPGLLLRTAGSRGRAGRGGAGRGRKRRRRDYETRGLRAERSAPPRPTGAHGVARGDSGKHRAPGHPRHPKCVCCLSTCCRCRGDRAPGPFPGLLKSPSVLRVKRRSVLWSSGKSF